jgi:N-acetyl-anhydromuramyl-L-alanine amidase AmpD
MIASTGQSADSLKIVSAPVDFGFRRCDNRVVDTIILHSICNPEAVDKFSLESIQAILKQYKVSSHYVILRDGGICRLVEEKDVAYHAGRSRLPVSPFRRELNGTSIGIELVCDPEGQPTEAQYEAAVKLVRDIKSRHEIKHVFGHEDVAPGRKTDPWGFDWGRFRITLDQEPTVNNP